MIRKYQITEIKDKNGKPKCDEDSLRRLNQVISTSEEAIRIGIPLVGAYITNIENPLCGKMLMTSRVVSITGNKNLEIETLNSVYYLKRV